MTTVDSAQPAPSKPSPEDYERLAATRHWFQAIDCGAFQTSGRFPPGTPQNRTLYGVFDFLRAMDFRGQTCLDIGAAEGLLSFGMKALGAARAVAVDVNDLTPLKFVRDILEVEVEIHPNLALSALPGHFEPASFDAIICAGVLYHLLEPFSALSICRRLIKEGGYFIMETAYAPGNDAPVMVFNPGAETNPEINTYWLPTRSALEHMMRAASFEVVATRTIHRMPRITVLGRAVKPAEVTGRTPLLEKMHQVDFCDPGFRLRELFAAPRVASDIRMEPVASFAVIDPAQWAGTFPYHPHVLSNPKGQTCWTTPSGNV